MAELLRAAWVIGRRDYAATVMSRAFLLFLIGPLLPLIFGGVFGVIGSQGAPGGGATPLVAIAGAAEGEGLVAARERAGGPAALRIVAPSGEPRAQAERLVAGGAPAVLAGGLDRPVLIGSDAAIADARDDVARLVDQARQARALAGAGRTMPARAVLATIRLAPLPEEAFTAREGTARAGQFVLVFLTMLLAGMLLSNLLEEKSNKVIEVLAAAVPVDAIFVGKLFAMLAMSLTGIAVWSATGLLIVGLISHAGVWPAALALAPPAVGWGVFAPLGLLYFTMSYLLLGAVFLGIGAQARSVREVQTISMPITMGQLIVFAFSSAAIGAPDGRLGWGAMLFPWSSPFAMMARAAELPTLWPHLLGLAWQALWVAVAIRVSARLFRRSVLNAGAVAAPRR